MLSIGGLKVKGNRLGFGPNFDWDLLNAIPAADLPSINWRLASLNVPARVLYKLRNKPGFAWNWREVTLSTQFSIEMMLSYPFPVVVRVAHLRHDFTFDVYRAHIERDWDHTAISRMDRFPIDIVIGGHAARELWDWRAISALPQYSMALAHRYRLPYHVSAYVEDLDGTFDESDYDRYPNIQWSAADLAEHVSRSFYERTPELGWDAAALSCVSWDVFDLIGRGSGWNFERLSSNEHLTVALLREDHPWHMDHATRRFTPDIVLANMDIAWDLRVLVKHPDFTADHVRTMPQVAWPWARMHFCAWVDGHFVIEFADKPWRASILAEEIFIVPVADAFVDAFEHALEDVYLRTLTPHASLSTIKKHAHLKWDWCWLARHARLTSLDLGLLPDIPHELVCENPHYIDLGSSLVDQMLMLDA